jgi:CRP-like cAMP-binding protein
MTVSADRLRAVPLFAGLTDRAFDAVAGLAVEQELPEGSVLAAEGGPGDAFFLVLDGRIAVTRDGSPVRELGGGDFLGEIALVDRRPRTATATALTQVTVAVIDAAAFTELMERHSAVRHGILVALTDRIRSDEAGTIA